MAQIPRMNDFSCLEGKCDPLQSYLWLLIILQVTSRVWIMSCWCWCFHVKVLRIELIHRDHPDSPLSTNASLSERLAACMERSERRRSRLLISSTDFQSSVNGDQILPEYMMKISLGTPPQERVAIIDTGSNLVWLKCQCGSNCQMPLNPLFDPTASTSYSAVPCNDSLCAEVTYSASYILNRRWCSANCLINTWRADKALNPSSSYCLHKISTVTATPSGFYADIPHVLLFILLFLIPSGKCSEIDGNRNSVPTPL